MEGGERMTTLRPAWLDYRLLGWNLIEAAAGTGKTYTIQNLVVRFLLERRLPIRSLLVVTFTEAAAAELRDRIRAVLTATLEAAQGQAAQERELLLLQQAEEAGVSREECVELLRHALLGFDEAPISTIHGFCAKILEENAFESGVLFRSELVKDVSGILAELGMDFYRRTFYGPGPELRSAMAVAAEVTPEKLLHLANLRFAHPELVVQSNVSGEPELFLQEAQTLLLEIRESGLPEALEEFAPYLNKLHDIHAVDAPAIAVSALNSNDVKSLLRFSLSALADKVKKKPKGTTAEAVLARLEKGPFVLLDRLDEVVRNYGVALRLAAADFIRREFAARCGRENFMTFHDLLNRVHEALHRPGGVLRSVLCSRYPVGIVDEFQDTDPIQYEIFRVMFQHSGGTLYMVGDPRQAIYSFRGGDVATYRRAVRELQASGGEKYELAVNYRSAAAMIADVNTLFHEHPDPFDDDSIHFPKVAAPQDSPAFIRDGVAETHPLRILKLPEAGEAECRRRTVQVVRELLTDPALQIPGQETPGVRPCDIAILVLRGYEAELLADDLHACHIPAVFTRTGNVFASEDARELLIVLRAASSGSVRLLANILATPIGGMSLSELVVLGTERGERRLAEEQEKLRKLQTLWDSASFIEFIHALLGAYDVHRRYPTLPRGERKLTNLLQLGDLLEQESSRRGLSPTGVADFLAERIAAPDKGDSEEYQQLLETDREAVTLMTVHGSKGLEFPIVLLPGLHLVDARKRAELFHNSDGELVYDLTASADGQKIAEKERLQELLRLAYVAVTRAKYHCRIIWGKGPERSALTWLLATRGAAALPEALLEQDDFSPPERHYRYIPEERVELELLPLQLAVDPAWQFVSYSSLSPQGRHDSPYDYDHDSEKELPEMEAPPESGIFSIRGGAAAGNAWHRIFELADFSADEETLRALALPPLSDFGVLRGGEDPEEKLSLTVRMVQDVFLAPLHGAGGECFRLADVPRADRLTELEFAYRFRSGFTTGALRDALASYAAGRFGLTEWPLWNRTVSGGCLNGFIDLFFRHNGRYYLLDWKSNRLEGRSANFSPERLPSAMVDSFYFLQYLIYTVAAVKYLRMRLGQFGAEEYEKLFGGVFYLFVRGVTPEHPGRGVFFDKPPFELIHRLEELIG